MPSLHLSLSGNNAWGMYNFRASLLVHFIEKGYRVSVLCPRDSVYFQKLADLGCEMHDVTVAPKGINPLKDVMLIVRYWILFQTIRPDMSITYTIKPNIYASIAATLRGLPHLPVTTGLGYTFLSKGVVSLVAKVLYRLAFRKAKEVWFLNQDDVSAFKSLHLVDPARVFQLNGEGIDLNRFSFFPAPQREKGKLIFLLIGRMIWDKGIGEFIEAVRVLKRMYPLCRFQLLGAIWEENPSAITRKQIQRWQEEQLVEYLGTTQDVRPFIKRCDCVVLPSYREGVPCTLMEGAACGRPLVATDVPGCREVVKPNHNGFLCKPKDFLDLASKMEAIIKMSSQERGIMGENGHKLMEEKFAMPLIIGQYDEIIGKVFYNKKQDNNASNQYHFMSPL